MMMGATVFIFFFLDGGGGGTPASVYGPVHVASCEIQVPGMADQFVNAIQVPCLIDVPGMRDVTEVIPLFPAEIRVVRTPETNIELP